MRRADRLFEIIQLLRQARRPLTAAAIAEQLEVAIRTVYRDVAALQGRRVPIEGAAGLGYVLRRGFDLPPLMFTIDEVEAIAIGARLVRRVKDATLQEAAARVLAKVAQVLPEPLRAHVAAPAIYVSEGNAAAPQGIDPAAVRFAIRENRKLRITYADESGTGTTRCIWPLAMAYYVDVTLIGAWCELRQDFRNFRLERIQSSQLLDERFPAGDGRLMAEWMALRKDRPSLVPC
jgi:predicted DNA-binding transcriptional regulator YafY